MNQIDALDGIFDTPDPGREDRGVRELVRNGIVRATVRSNAIGVRGQIQIDGMREPFGTYPARSNARQIPVK